MHRYYNFIKRGEILQCFGNFECYVDGEPLEFKRKKSKEVFAYLVDWKITIFRNREMGHNGKREK